MMQAEPDAVRIKIIRLDIAQSYFKGRAVLDGQECTINIQGHWQDRILRLPRYRPEKDRTLVRFTGKNETYVEDYLEYRGESEWIEIDSDTILHYIADHQDQLDTLEIVL